MAVSVEEHGAQDDESQNFLKKARKLATSGDNPKKIISLVIFALVGLWVFNLAPTIEVAWVCTILLITILFFLYSMFIILRQKRLSEMQKDFINNMTHHAVFVQRQLSVSIHFSQ